MPETPSSERQEGKNNSKYKIPSNYAIGKTIADGREVVGYSVVSSISSDSQANRPESGTVLIRVQDNSDGQLRETYVDLQGNDVNNLNLPDVLVLNPNEYEILN